MAAARITGQGLFAMAVSVALLWGCLVSEHLMRQRALAEQTRVLRDIEMLRQRYRSLPVSSPLPSFHHHRVRLTTA
jgi:hypothetical protein